MRVQNLEERFRWWSVALLQHWKGRIVIWELEVVKCCESCFVWNNINVMRDIFPQPDSVFFHSAYDTQRVIKPLTTRSRVRTCNQQWNVNCDEIYHQLVTLCPDQSCTNGLWAFHHLRERRKQQPRIPVQQETQNWLMLKDKLIWQQEKRKKYV